MLQIEGLVDQDAWLFGCRVPLRKPKQVGEPRKASLANTRCCRRHDRSAGLTNLKLVPVGAAEFERLRLRDGDLLFVRTNGNPDPVGRFAVYESVEVAASVFSGNKIIFASYLIRARLAEANIAPVFLREYHLGDQGRRQLRSRSKTSAGRFDIDTDSLGAIPVPPSRYSANSPGE
jgi:hypothetical protein